MKLKKILFGNPKDNPTKITGVIAAFTETATTATEKDACPNTECVACRVNCPHK